MGGSSSLACCNTGEEPQPPAADAPTRKPVEVRDSRLGDDADDERINDGNHEELKATTEVGAMDEGYRFWERYQTSKRSAQKVPTTNKQLTLQRTIHATMKATLGGGELRHTVKLPPGEDLNEWIAVNTVHFYNAANMIYGTCVEFCTEQSCPTMSAGRNEYLWKDGVKYKKPTRVPAPVYIDELLAWVNAQISDPTLFPTDEGKFPPKFMMCIRNIYKRLFRLYAHIYWSHFDKIRSIGANAHLNTCFKHFAYFILEFNLVDKKGMAPLEKFIEKFKNADGA
jgi:MOB kinase activator 1